MFNITSYKRFEGETPEQLIFRITGDKEQIGSWKKVAEILNELLGTNYTESKFRKQRQAFDKLMDANRDKFVDSETQLLEIDEKKRELERAKIAFRDERNAWQKQNYADKRVEEVLDILEDKLKEIGKVEFNSYRDKDRSPLPKSDDKELIVCLSDLHIGQTFSSVFGKYNSDIAIQRISKYLDTVLDVAKLHDVSKIHVVNLGDTISGNIHKSIAVTNKEDVIEQIKLSTSLISSFCHKLCEYYRVYFYNVSGNHSRIDRKDDALHDERLDDVIGWAVNLSLDHVENFHYMKHRNLDIGIVDLSVCGKSYIGCHGDYDKMSKQGVANLCMMLGFVPYGILRGHMHYPAMNEFNGVKVIQSGSLAGAGDTHTIECRLVGNPSQTMCVCNCSGIECIYNVDLS